MNINELMNINGVRESATIFPRTCKLTFDHLTSKVVSESRVTWATSVPILVFIGLSVLDLGLMYATDRQTSEVKRSKVNFQGAGAYSGGLFVVYCFYSLLLLLLLLICPRPVAIKR